MRVRRAVVAAAVLSTMVGCGSSDESRPQDADASDASSGLVLTDITTDTSGAARVTGTFELRSGCVLLESGNDVRLAVWPTGSTLDSTSQPPTVQLPDSGPVAIDGVERTYGGGTALPDSFPGAADCAEESELDEVWLMSPRWLSSTRILTGYCSCPSL